MIRSASEPFDCLTHTLPACSLTATITDPSPIFRSWLPEGGGGRGEHGREWGRHRQGGGCPLPAFSRTEDHLPSWCQHHLPPHNLSPPPYPSDCIYSTETKGKYIKVYILKLLFEINELFMQYQSYFLKERQNAIHYIKVTFWRKKKMLYTISNLLFEKTNDLSYI